MHDSLGRLMASTFWIEKTVLVAGDTGFLGIRRKGVGYKVRRRYYWTPRSRCVLWRGLNLSRQRARRKHAAVLTFLMARHLIDTVTR